MITDDLRAGERPLTNQWEEAKRLAALAIDAAYAAGCGDSYSQLDVDAARAEGAKVEREACAVICETYRDTCGKPDGDPAHDVASVLARCIRARGKERL